MHTFEAEIDFIFLIGLRLKRQLPTLQSDFLISVLQAVSLDFLMDDGIADHLLDLFQLSPMSQIILTLLDQNGPGINTMHTSKTASTASPYSNQTGSCSSQLTSQYS